MDFHLIHEHPWLTTGAVLGGGFVLYLLIHKSGTGAGTADGTVYAASSAPTVDPTVAAQIAAQQAQINGQVQGLNIQGQTQLGLAQINAQVQGLGILASQDVTNRQTAASEDVTNRQTDAQLQLGLGTLSAQVAHDWFGAQVQMKTIDAIVQAFSGNHPIDNPTPTVSVPVSNSSNPISAVTPPQTVNISPPTYGSYPWGPGTDPGPLPGTVGSGAVVPGGQQLVAPPAYVTSDPSQYPGMAAGAQCSPLDANCVATNEALSNQYHQTVAQDQTINNLTQLVSNYQQSVTAGTITPQQSQELSYYSGQLQAAGGVVPTAVTPAPARIFPAQVNTY